MTTNELGGRSMVALVMLAVCALVACGGNSGPTPTPPPPTPPPASPVAGVVVSPRGLTLPVGGSGQLSAVAKDANGAAVSGVTVTWSTVDQTVATVASDGTVSGNAAGQTRAVAAAGNKADTVDVLVIDNFSLDVAPAAATAKVGQTAPFTVVAHDGLG